MNRINVLVIPLTAVLLSLFLLCPAIGSPGDEGPLPIADQKGDFHGRTLHRHWMVVDKDHGGLNGRLSKEFPSNWLDCRAEWPKVMDIDAWPVVTSFYHGTVLNGASGDVGVIFVKDVHGDSWMMVSLGSGRICFVRANSRYIRPVVVNEP